MKVSDVAPLKNDSSTAILLNSDPSSLVRHIFVKKNRKRNKRILKILIIDTSRPMRPLEVDGHTYWFRQREDMEKEIRSGEFLEYGEHNGHLYGTHFDAIRSVIDGGNFFLVNCTL